MTAQRVLGRVVRGQRGAFASRKLPLLDFELATKCEESVEAFSGVIKGIATSLSSHQTQKSIKSAPAPHPARPSGFSNHSYSQWREASLGEQPGSHPLLTS
jgi:hypothetical protein